MLYIVKETKYTEKQSSYDCFIMTIIIAYGSPMSETNNLVISFSTLLTFWRF